MKFPKIDELIAKVFFLEDFVIFRTLKWESSFQQDRLDLDLPANSYTCLNLVHVLFVVSAGADAFYEVNNIMIVAFQQQKTISIKTCNKCS